MKSRVDHAVAKTTRVLVGAVVGVLLLAGCASTEPQMESPPADDVLAAHDLDGLDGREVIDQLEALPVADRPADLLASVRPDAVVVSDDGGAETSLALPQEEFYVSVAPYVDQTHDCFFHSLTTCLGELRNEEVRVLVTDSADGAVLIDEVRSTNDNGFIGLWLPRGIDATITVEHDGRSNSSAISTRDDSPTCLTTLQLT